MKKKPEYRVTKADVACGGWHVQLSEADYRASGGRISWGGSHGPFESEAAAVAWAQSQGAIKSETIDNVLNVAAFGIDHIYNHGDRVRVDDDTRKFSATVMRPNPKNSAEYEVADAGGGIWCVHWAYLRHTAPPPRRELHEVVELDRDCDLGSKGERAVVVEIADGIMKLVFPSRDHDRVVRTGTDYRFLRSVS